MEWNSTQKGSRISINPGGKHIKSEHHLGQGIHLQMRIITVNMLSTSYPTLIQLKKKKKVKFNCN